jgi:hypothetical protein
MSSEQRWVKPLFFVAVCLMPGDFWRTSPRKIAPRDKARARHRIAVIGPECAVADAVLPAQNPRQFTAPSPGRSDVRYVNAILDLDIYRKGLSSWTTTWGS